MEGLNQLRPVLTIYFSSELYQHYIANYNYLYHWNYKNFEIKYTSVPS